MSLQAWITVALVLLSLLYFLRSSLKSLLGKGCASGCGSCKACACPGNKVHLKKQANPAK